MKTETKTDPSLGGLVKDEYLSKKPPRASKVKANPLDGQRTAHRNNAMVDMEDPNRAQDYFHFYHAAHSGDDLATAYTVPAEGIKIARPRLLGER
jgi:hypothetical protein